MDESINRTFRECVARTACMRDESGARTLDDWRTESMIYADWLEEQGRSDLAERRRARALSPRRQAECLWPRPYSLDGLTPHQRACCRRALTSRVACLVGTPGTGKTYTTAAIVRELIRRHGVHRVAVAAPTGKAAVRITSALQAAGVQSPASTIHQLLEIGRNGHDGQGWGFQRNARNPLREQFVIVDEASMLDVDLAAAMLEAIPTNGHLLLVGDPYQLPPVGHGAPLRDMLASQGVPSAELTEIRRNAGMIVENCARMKAGKSLEFATIDDWDADKNRNHVHVEAIDTADILNMAIRVMAHLGVNYQETPRPQFVAATNAVRTELNSSLQSVYNLHGVRGQHSAFRVGDPIICTKNGAYVAADLDNGDEAYYVANGEIGTVVGFDAGNVLADFTEPRRSIRIPAGPRQRPGESEPAAGDFDLAYCITGHKSQGSEWPVVIVVIESGFGARRVCSREWIYTAISRAKRLCVTIGRRGVLEQMARRPVLERRKTFLRELLDGEPE